MLQYDMNSWHCRLVLYVYGEKFFSTKYIDQSMIKTDEDFEKILKSPEKFSKTKPKHVNFCPYCRAVVISIVLFPLSAILKRLPQKTRKEMTFLELKKNREKRMRIIFGIFGSLHFALGLYNIIAIPDSIWAGVVQISLGLMFVFFPKVSEIIGKFIPHLISFYNKLKPFLIKLKILKIKTKPRKMPRLHSPPFVKAFFTENHDKYCPPVFFVDKNTEEIHR